MDVVRGIRRRLEIFASFREGRRLLQERRFAVVRGKPQSPDGNAPCIWVSRVRNPKSRVSNVRLTMFVPDGRALAYAAAEEIDDYLSNILGFKRVVLRDEDEAEGVRLFLEYAYPFPEFREIE